MKQGSILTLTNLLYELDQFKKEAMKVSFCTKCLSAVTNKLATDTDHTSADTSLFKYTDTKVK